jgi:L-lactate dehydrogenase complex protein LldG
VTEGRDQILGAIRAALGRGDPSAEALAAVEQRLAEPRANVVPVRGQVSGEAAVAAFVFEAERIIATTERVGRRADVPAACAAYLKAANLPARIKAAPHPRLIDMPWSQQPLVSIAFGAAAPDDEVGLSFAFAAVAETGTLVLVSGTDSPTLLNFLPDRHIVVVPADRIVGCYEETMAMIRRERPLAGSRIVNWVTGQSRTADIEQTLLLGAHGPKHLHILITDEQNGGVERS